MAYCPSSFSLSARGLSAIRTAFFETLLPFIVVGFVAQLVDGALGMAFGVISTTLFVTLGVFSMLPAAAAGAPS